MSGAGEARLSDSLQSVLSATRQVEAEVDSPKTKSTQAPAAESFRSGSTEHD